MIIVPAHAPAALQSTALTCSPWGDSEDAPCDPDDFAPGLLDRCLQASSDLLFELTGRRWPGLCTDTIRPVRRCRCWGSSGTRRSSDISEPCPCEPAGAQPLPGRPVVSISEVKVDGAVLAPSAYRVDNRAELVRTDGGGWYCCQDMTAAASAAGTWQVEYTYGEGPPDGGKLAAGALGCQLATLLTPAKTGECRLPKRVQTVTRQGVTAVVLDPMTFLEKGRTGLYEVDLFLAAVNRAGIQRAATVRRPERGRSARRTG